MIAADVDHGAAGTLGEPFVASCLIISSRAFDAASPSLARTSILASSTSAISTTWSYESAPHDSTRVERSASSEASRPSILSV